MMRAERRRTWLRQAGIGGAAALLLLGATAAAPPRAGAQAKKEIVIGCTLPLTGAFAAFGRYFVDVYRFWEEEVNAKGGLLGSKVRLIIYDDKSDSSTSVSLYTKLITVDKADLLVGGFPTPVVLPVMPIAEKHKMLFVQGGANARDLITRGNYRYTVTTLTTDQVWSEPLWEWLGSMPAERRPRGAAFVQQVNPLMQGIVAAATPKAKGLGIEVLAVETFASDTQDFTAMLQKFKAGRVDFVFAATNYPPGLTFFRTVAEIEFRPKLLYIATGPTVPAWIKDLGARTDGVFTSVPYWHTLKGGGNERFVRAIEARYGYTPVRESGQGYTPLQVLQRAVEATGNLHQDVLREYIGSQTFETVSGPMKFDAHGFGTSRSYLMQVQQDKQVLVYPPSVKTAEAVYPRP